MDAHLGGKVGEKEAVITPGSRDSGEAGLSLLVGSLPACCVLELGLANRRLAASLGV